MTVVQRWPVHRRSRMVRAFFPALCRIRVRRPRIWKLDRYLLRRL